MTLVPKTIHFIYPVWENTRPLSYVNEVAVRLARKHHPDYQIKFWLSGTPTPNQHWEAIQELVEIHPYEAYTHWNGEKVEWPQYSSDISRLDILRREGGIYMDTDMLCLKPLNHWMGDKLVMCWEDFSHRSICNAMMISPPGNRFLEHWLIGIGDAMKGGVWAEGGVLLPARIWYSSRGKFSDTVDIIGSKYFCPFDLSAQLLFENARVNMALDKVSESYAIHVFETYWRNVVKDITPDWCRENDCLFSRIVKDNGFLD